MHYVTTQANKYDKYMHNQRAVHVDLQHIVTRTFMHTSKLADSLLSHMDTLLWAWVYTPAEYARSRLPESWMTGNRWRQVVREWAEGLRAWMFTMAEWSSTLQAGVHKASHSMFE